MQGSVKRLESEKRTNYHPSRFLERDVGGEAENVQRTLEATADMLPLGLCISFSQNGLRDSW